VSDNVEKCFETYIHIHIYISLSKLFSTLSDTLTPLLPIYIILCPLRPIKMTDIYFDNLCSFGMLCLHCWSDRYLDATVIRGIL